MKNQRITALISVMSFLSAGNAQSPDLAALQSKLTVDCKSIRGHSSRIVAEASAAEFNQAVAAAHLEQVASFHTSMENDLKATAEVMTAEQQKRVAGEMKALNQICETIGKAIKDLESEFSVSAPKPDSIRRIAVGLKNEMSRGYEIHERLKKKLGII